MGPSPGRRACFGTSGGAFCLCTLFQQLLVEAQLTLQGGNLLLAAGELARENGPMFLKTNIPVRDPQSLKRKNTCYT